MFREHWRKPRFWAWWVSKGAPARVRWTLGYLGIAAVLGAGFLAADQLAQVNASGPQFGTGLLQAPGGVRIVTHPIVRYVPVVKKTSVTLDGKRRVLTKSVLVPAVRTETQTITSQQDTSNQNASRVVTVVATVPVTVRQTTTQPTTVVVTQSLPGQTVTTTQTVTQPSAVAQPVTVTQFAMTVTLPATTVAITLP